MPKTQIKPLIAMRGGLRYDIPADLIASTDMADCRNVFFEDGLVKKRFGYVQKGDNLPLAGAVTGMDQFYNFKGDSWLLPLTTKLAYKWLPNDSLWETISEAEVEDDCETTWTSDMGANGAVADEITIKKVGTKSQKITVNTAFETGLIAHRDQTLGDKSAYGFVRLWVRADTAVPAGSLQFCVDDTAGCGSPTETVNFPALVKDTWKIVIIEFADPATNMTSIESLGLKVAVDLSTSANVIIYLDDIQFVKSFGPTVAYDADSEDLFSSDYIRKTTETDPWWIITNGVDPIKKWTGGSAALSNLISAYPAGVTALLAKHVLEFKDHLLLLDVSEDSNRYPQRIRWPDTADPEDFLNGNASYQDLSGPDWIAGGVKFKGDYVIIFKERSIWVGYATGDSDIFMFDLKVSGAGCAAGKTIESLGDEIIFLGWDDIYVFNGIDYESVATNVQRRLISTLNPEQLGKAFGFVIEEQKEYWLFIPSTSSTYPDIAWCFNYNLNKWTYHSFSDFISMYGYHELQATKTWADLVGTWDEQNWRWDDRTTLKAAPTNLFGDTSGYIYEYDRTANNDDGVAIDGWFATKDFNPTQLMQRFRMLRFDIYYTGRWDVSYSIDKGASWVAIKTLTANNEIETPQSVYLRLDCLMCRLRFRNNYSGEHAVFSRASMHWQPAGARL